MTIQQPEVTNQKPTKTGRPKQTKQDKIRKNFMKKTSRSEYNYFWMMSNGFFITYSKIKDTIPYNHTQLLDRRHLAEEISHFIENQALFLTMLQTVNIENHLSIDDCLIANYQNQHITSQLRRTPAYGISKLKHMKGLKDSQLLKLRQCDIKCLYIACILLIGNGQIDFLSYEKNSQTSISQQFRRIVTKLLMRNKFFTKATLYYIQDQWQNIIQIIQNGIVTLLQDFEDQDQPAEQAFQRIPLRIEPQQNGYGSVQLIQKCSIKKFDYNIQQERSQCIFQENSLDLLEYQPWFYCMGHQNQSFFNQKKMNQSEKEKVQYKIKKNLNLDCQNKEQISIQKAQELFIGPIKPREIIKAEEEFNYAKINTIVRKPKKQALNLQNTATTNNIEREISMVEENEYDFIQSSQEYFHGQDSQTDKIEQEEEKSTQIRKENLHQQNSTNLIPIIHNDQCQITVNPKRLVRHNFREIDSMVDMLVQDDFCWAHSIGNMLFHLCKTLNVQIIYQKRSLGNEKGEIMIQESFEDNEIINFPL